MRRKPIPFLSTLNGISVIYELIPANSNEAVMDYLVNCDIIAEKGFPGLEQQTRILDQTNSPGRF